MLIKVKDQVDRDICINPEEVLKVSQELSKSGPIKCRILLKGSNNMDSQVATSETLDEVFDKINNAVIENKEVEKKSNDLIDPKDLNELVMLKNVKVK